jgi:hypothetical protein
MNTPASNAKTAINGAGRPSGTIPATPYNTSQIPRSNIPTFRLKTIAIISPPWRRRSLARSPTIPRRGQS